MPHRKLQAELPVVHSTTPGYNFKNVRTLHEAGILLGMDTDGNLPPGNWFGNSLQREMELHAMAGLAPVDIIRIATYNGAKILRLVDEIGSVEEGKIADLLIVTGNPADSISDTRNIRYVLQGGEIVDREALQVK